MLSDASTKQRLAGLVPEALELGTGKYEQDGLADDLFGTFGVDLNELAATIPRRAPNRKAALCRAAADALAAGAPSAAALMTAMVRCGGRFVAMVEEIYSMLAEHVATTSGSSEHFLIKRADLDLEIMISQAFIERLRELQRAIRRVDVGQVDQGAMGGFVGWDGGELWGTWPIRDSNGLRLLDAVLHLGWLDAAGTAAAAQHSLRAARAAADRLVATAEHLVDSHMTHLGELADDDFQAAFTNLTEWNVAEALAELQRFHRDGVLAQTASSSYITGLDQTSNIGLRRQPAGDSELRLVITPDEDYHSATGMSALAGFLAMRRAGMYAHRSRSALEESLGAGLVSLADWLDGVRNACDEATAWLRDEAVVPTGSIDVDELVERFVDYLNLPLWRCRALLYEIWILCAALGTCREVGWSAHLRCLEQDGDLWLLSTKPTTTPVAELRFDRDSTIGLDVWREPRRTTDSGEVTPDVTISTPGPSPRDLVVIEAKDRYRMRSGSADDHRSALGVATKYRAALRPITTWVCNHCDFREGGTDPAANYGDVWSRVHIAAPFRPGTIPPAFQDDIAAALTPPGTAAAQPEPRSDHLLLAIDVTGSMVRRLPVALDALRGLNEDGYSEFRAVLYSDHGRSDPFVVRDVGPCDDLATLLQQIKSQPSGGGGDEEEALEDAMRRCREIATDIGPLTLVVLTDAPPHSPTGCPLAIDFDAEVRLLLATGSRCLVADDWQEPNDTSWQAFVPMPGFERAPLQEIAERLAARSA